jgi:hypothetical protein
LDEKLDKVKQECAASRKHMLKLHKAVQSMDIANASDCIFYNDDSDDIGFVIRGKEYHLHIPEDGEVELVPMLQHRRSRKQKDEPTDVMNENGDVVIDEDLDNLYADLVE